jgi:hypothetical protein
MIEKIESESKLLALIVRSGFSKDGIEFFTPEDFSQQLGYMKRQKGYVVRPHLHLPVVREIVFTKEVLFIKSGKVRIDFYDQNENYLESKILASGDVILLAFGGHGIEVLEEAEIIEVKQGPYAGEFDKNRFEPIEIGPVIYK